MRRLDSQHNAHNQALDTGMPTIGSEE
jgi:hypothetical protein